MASAWIQKRERNGLKRWRVFFRVGGRETKPTYAGSFKTQKEALARRAWIVGELASNPDRLPTLKTPEPESSPTLREVAEQRGTIRPDYAVAREAAVAFHARLRQLLPAAGGGVGYVCGGAVGHGVVGCGGRVRPA